MVLSEHPGEYEYGRTNGLGGETTQPELKLCAPQSERREIGGTQADRQVQQEMIILQVKMIDGAWKNSRQGRIDKIKQIVHGNPLLQPRSIRQGSMVHYWRNAQRTLQPLPGGLLCAGRYVIDETHSQTRGQKDLGLKRLLTKNDSRSFSRTSAVHVALVKLEAASLILSATYAALPCPMRRDTGLCLFANPSILRAIATAEP
ncbi:predicted protein [Plenodomus lingam JN3]|uniref:Predicted protein n=1 Tax=Leptosphaeria maculans (strain JN3 / isolate v23.1.3 / race Av1-4-5-6-7-8) TaxID=985895 RepID=E4ZJN7_LEPMJ|nr:predicted protein [Plenodomus lingam JN3]CBX91322.1 predicted protein [Plenodomus lingam JN3]